METIVNSIVDFYKAQPFLGTLLTLMLIDIASGINAAVITKSLSSTVSWAGMFRKVQTLLIVSLAVVLEKAGMASVGLPLGKVAATFFCFTEGLSILENAARSGVPIPQALVDTLQKLSTKEKASVTDKPEEMEKKP